MWNLIHDTRRLIDSCTKNVVHPSSGAALEKWIQNLLEMADTLAKTGVLKPEGLMRHAAVALRHAKNLDNDIRTSRAAEFRNRILE